MEYTRVRSFSYAPDLYANLPRRGVRRIRSRNRIHYGNLILAILLGAGISLVASSETRETVPVPQERMEPKEKTHSFQKTQKGMEPAILEPEYRLSDFS